MPFGYSATSQNMPPWYEQFIIDLLTRSRNLSNEYDREGHYVTTGTGATQKVEWVPTEEPEAMRARIAALKYNKDRVVPPGNDINAAYEMGRKTGIPKGHFDASRQGIQNSNTPFYEEYGQYMSPYIKDVIEDIRNDAMENFNDNIAPSIANQFVSLGQHGSSRHKDAILEASNNLQKMISSKSNAARHQGYETAARMFNADKERRLHAAQAEGELGRMEQASHLADIDTLMRQGIQEQAQRQAVAEKDYADYLMEENRKRNILIQHASIMNQLPYQGEAITSSYQPNPNMQPHLNWQGQMGNIAGQMFGAHMQRRARGGAIRKRKSKLGPHLMNIRRKK